MAVPSFVTTKLLRKIKEMQVIENKAYSQYEISSFETDAFYEARLNYYFGIIQDVGAKHSALKGMSIADLQKIGLTWVITRSIVDIYHYGVWMDILNAQTWAQKCQLFHCPRLVKLFDVENKPILHAQTMWAIIDAKTGRPVRPESYIVDQIGLPEESVREDSKVPKFPTYQTFVKREFSSYSPKIAYLDTDYNHHVNNISYVNWINEALPTSFRDKYKMSFIDCRWLKQTFRKDKITVFLGSATEEDEMQAKEPKLYFRIERQNENDVENVFEAYTEWKERGCF